MNEQRLRGPVFMSLGSQYSLRQAISFLLAPASNKDHADLKKFLSQRFAGETELYYKGRDAIVRVLEKLRSKKTGRVFLQGFTCFALEEAIIKAGFEPCFVDVADLSLNPGVRELDIALAKFGQPDAIILQHTLGVPADTKNIKKWCQKNSVVLIDDLAQSFGAKDGSGQELGSNADAVIVSFGRDKVVDGISGGALIIRNPDLFVSDHLSFEKISLKTSILDRIYPLLTVMIRKTYQAGLGKIIHFSAKKLGILKTPLFSNESLVRSMPGQNAKFILKVLKNLPQIENHRQKIARVYFEGLSQLDKQKIRPMVNQSQIENSSNLRFPLWVIDPEKLINFLGQKNIFVKDRWYRTVVDCSSLDCKSVYTANTCSSAEGLAKHAIQLPTHQEVSVKTARQIAAIISSYYQANNNE